MAALPYPIYSLENLHLFPVYKSREEYYKKTEKAAPPFNPQKPPKFWFDPRAAQSPTPQIVYQNVVAMDKSGLFLLTDGGRPFTVPLVLYRDDAAALNIPDDRNPVPIAIPVPLRPLEPGEELYLKMGGGVGVRNQALWKGNLEQMLTDGFTAADRALLHAIAHKLHI